MPNPTYRIRPRMGSTKDQNNAKDSKVSRRSLRLSRDDLPYTRDIFSRNGPSGNVYAPTEQITLESIYFVNFIGHRINPKVK